MRLWQRSMIALARNESLKKFMQSRAAMSGLATRFVGQIAFLGEVWVNERG
jgi:hypothetical protein